jgi:hypothetical protein
VKTVKRHRLGSIIIASLLGILIVPVIGAGPFQGAVPVALAAEDSQEALEKVREELDELWEYIDELEERLVDEEKKSAWDRVHFYGDFRVRYAYEYWKLPAQSNFPTFTDFVKIGTPELAGDTIRDIIAFLFANQLPLQSRDPFTLANDQSFQLRFRLKMKAEVTPRIHFQGRLKVLSDFGAGIVDPIFNGSPNTVFYSFNAANIPSDTVVRLERAYVTWLINKTPLVLTIGRQASTEGPPRHMREDRVRQGTPPANLIDAEVDGIMLGWKMHKTFESLPPTTVRVCYGLGYEAGFGGGGRVQKSTVNTGLFRFVAVDGMKDMTVLGGCADTKLPFLSENSLLSLAYFRGMNITDIASGITVNFPDPWSSNQQRVTATQNLGDIDLLGFVLMSENLGFEWFASFGMNMFHPNGKVSKYGFGSLGNNDPKFAEQLGSDPNEDPSRDRTGYSFWVGIRVPVQALRGKLGLEYNYGSKYWFSFTQAADDINNKIATRGYVFEPYYLLNVHKNVVARFGYQYYRYNYSLSGWQLGTPTPVEDGGVYFYPTPKEIHNAYLQIEFRF